jgi:hypothetical protein
MSKVSLNGRTGALVERHGKDIQNEDHHYNRYNAREDLRFVGEEQDGTGMYSTSLSGRTGAVAERRAKPKKTECDDIIADYEERLRKYENELKKCKMLKASGGRFTSRRKCAKRISTCRKSKH